MNRLRPVVVGVVATLVVVLVASSCSLADPPALTVDDWTLTRSELIDELDALEASPTVAQFLGLTPAAGAAPTGGTTTTSPSIATANSAALLDAHVQIRVMGMLFAELGLTEPSAAELDQVRQSLTQQLQGEVPAELEPLFDQLVLAVAQQAAIESELLADVDVEAEARALYDEQVETGAIPEQTCLDVIVKAPDIVTDPTTGQREEPDAAELAASEAAAADVLARLDDGADFGELATNESDDADTAAAQGDLGCFQPGELNPVIEEPASALEVGEYSEVVDYGAGYVIVRVRSRGVIPYATLEAQLTQTVQSQARTERVGGRLQETARDADVTVDPLFGVWDAEQGRVLSPEGAQPAPVTLLEEPLEGVDQPLGVPDTLPAELTPAP